MLLFTLLLSVLPALAAPANGGNACTQSPYSLIMPFSSYAPAQTFCWSQYPGSTHWTTTTRPPKTVWSTHTSKGCYTYTRTSTPKCPTTTATMTTTSPPVTLPTITISYPPIRGSSFAAKKLKRNDPTSSAWKSCTSKLMKSGNKYMSTACSCIETTRTSTVTKPATTTTTSITTVTVYTSSTTMTMQAK
ncbi:hypothetical protein LTR53_007531 [Teratosphaeriaceae sp. CCFEE 6253]|nr:hypothetical protein LTR53_007531 [Teratosphaeriaceae sp. CCFEE 6253]